MSYIFPDMSKVDRCSLKGIENALLMSYWRINEGRDKHIGLMDESGNVRGVLALEGYVNHEWQDTRTRSFRRVKAACAALMALKSLDIGLAAASCLKACAKYSFAALYGFRFCNWKEQRWNVPHPLPPNNWQLWIIALMLFSVLKIGRGHIEWRF